MKMEMYSVWDRKTQVMMPPVCYHNRQQAMRELSMYLESNPSSTVAKYPDDFALMCVGTWDDHDGRITPRTAEWICSLMSLVPKTVAPAAEGPQVIPFGSPLPPPLAADQAPPSNEAGGADRPSE